MFDRPNIGASSFPRGIGTSALAVRGLKPDSEGPNDYWPTIVLVSHLRSRDSHHPRPSLFFLPNRILKRTLDLRFTVGF